MNIVFNAIPVTAIALAQIEAPDASKLTGYGALGIVCLWLMWRDEKRSKDHEITRGVMSEVAHEMRGLNLNWLMHNATHSPSEGIRRLAQKELERKQTDGASK